MADYEINVDPIPRENGRMGARMRGMVVVHRQDRQGGQRKVVDKVPIYALSDRGLRIKGGKIGLEIVTADQGRRRSILTRRAAKAREESGK